MSPRTCALSRTNICSTPSLFVFCHLDSELSKPLPVLSILGHVRCRAPLSGCSAKSAIIKTGHMFAWCLTFNLSLLLMCAYAVSIEHYVKIFPHHCLAFKYKQLAYKVQSYIFQVLRIFIFISVTFKPVTLACTNRVVLVYSSFNDLVIALCIVIEMAAMHYYTRLMV